jgi:hypothetical protein
MADAVSRLTRLYDTETMADVLFVENATTEELPVACTYIDNFNYTLLTTRRLIILQNGSNYVIPFQDVRTYCFADFKGMKDKLVTTGSLTTVTGEHIPLLIETGKPSMVLVNAVSTLLTLTKQPST